MKPNIRAIYFDLDDTLCAYWAASRAGLTAAFEEAELACGVDDAMKAWRKVFKQFYNETKEPHWYVRYLKSGEPTRTEQMRRTLEELGCADVELAHRMSMRYAELRDANLKLFPEARAVLEFLYGKYKLGLITNGPADVQRQEIATLGIEKYFDHVLIEGEFRVGKPHPEIFEAASEKWSFDPSEMLFVGNAFEHDVQGAKLAGWHSLWINKEMEKNPGTEPQPDGEIQSLWEVLDWLGIERPELAEDEPQPAQRVQNWRA